MKALNKILLVISLLFSAEVALAQKAVNAKRTSDFAKFDLESKLRSRIEQNLTSLLGEVDFLVNVSLDLKVKSVKPKADPTADADRKKKNFLFLDRLGMWTVTGKKSEGEEFFESIGKIKVKVVVPKDILENYKPAIEVAVDNSLFGFPENVRNTEITELPETRVAAADSDWQVAKSSLLRYSGLLLPVLAFCLTFLLVGFLRSRGETTQTVNATQIGDNAGSAQGFDRVEKDVTPIQTSAVPLPAIEGGQVPQTSFVSDQMVGFSGFKGLVVEQPRVASLFIKQWVNSNDPEAQSCLMAISRSDFVADLLPLLHNLTVDERKRWQSMNRGLPPAGYLAAANNFLARSLFDRELVPPIVEDDEMQTLLSELTVEDCIQLAQQNPEILAQILNIIPSDMISAVLRGVSDEDAKLLVEKSINFDQDRDLNVAGLQKALKGLVVGRSDEKPSPFKTALGEIVANVDAVKEQIIFDHIKGSGDRAAYLDLAYKLFPAELIWELPVNFMRAFITQMESKTRLELIFSQPDSVRESFFKVIGENKLKEMIDLEISELNDNFALARKVKDQEQDNWQNFVESVRKAVDLNPETKEQAKLIINNHAENYFTDEAPDDVEKVS